MLQKLRAGSRATLQIERSGRRIGSVLSAGRFLIRCATQSVQPLHQHGFVLMKFMSACCFGVFG